MSPDWVPLWFWDDLLSRNLGRSCRQPPTLHHQTPSRGAGNMGEARGGRLTRGGGGQLVLPTMHFRMPLLRPLAGAFLKTTGHPESPLGSCLACSWRVSLFVCFLFCLIRSSRHVSALICRALIKLVNTSPSSLASDDARMSHGVTLSRATGGGVHSAWPDLQPEVEANQRI